MKTLSIILLIAACTNSSYYSGEPNILSGQSIKDTTITVRVKDSFEISLPVSMGTGYRWELEDSLNKKLLSLENIIYKNADISIPGSTGTQTFIFKAISKGKIKIHLVHLQPWNKASKNDEKEYIIIIHQKN